MNPKVTSPAVLNLRAVLITAALICLCVSSNVGLQFFPLPAAMTSVAVEIQLDQPNTALHVPYADAQSFRVPMMRQLKKRADREQTKTDQFIELPNARFDLARNSFGIQNDEPVCFLTPTAMAPSAGRAPPSFGLNI